MVNTRLVCSGPVVVWKENMKCRRAAWTSTSPEVSVQAILHWASSELFQRRNSWTKSGDNRRKGLSSPLYLLWKLKIQPVAKMLGRTLTAMPWSLYLQHDFRYIRLHVNSSGSHSNSHQKREIRHMHTLTVNPIDCWWRILQTDVHVFCENRKLCFSSNFRRRIWDQFSYKVI